MYGVKLVSKSANHFLILLTLPHMQVVVQHACPACCDTAHLPHMLWHCAPARHVVAQRTCPACCGTAHLPGMLWHSAPARHVVAQRTCPACCGIAHLPGMLWHCAPARHVLALRTCVQACYSHLAIIQSKNVLNDFLKNFSITLQLSPQLSCV